MFENTQDILNIAKAVAVLGLSVLIGLFFYYLAMGTRQIFLIIKEMRDRTKKLDELIDLAKEKLSHSTAYLYLISEGVKKIAEVVKKFSGKKKDKKEKNTEK